MKIRDLKIDNYVVVNDLGAGKYSSGMRVIGKVVKIDPCGNSAIIESLPKHRYEITDFNDFDLWSNYIESKTESVSKVGLRNLNVGDWIQYVENNGQSEYGKYIKKVVKMHKFKTVLELEKINGVHVYIDENTDFIRIPAEWAEKLEKLRKEKIKEAQEMLIGINDVYESSDLQQRKRHDMVNSPSHYNYGDVEVIDYCDQVCKTYPPQLAPYVFNAIKYLSRANYKNGQEDINKAKYYVQRLFDMWDVK